MVTVEDYRWLVSDAAKPWLDVARDVLSGGRVVTTTILSRLRKDLSGERAHLVIEQVDLRRRAREKFTQPSEMFFTRQGLEQATDERIGAYKAGRFPPGCQIADLCCGVGGDLIALAGRGPTVGVDSDPVMGILAEANARVHGLSGEQCQVVFEDAVQFPVDRKHWHCDPDRRVEGKRATRGEFLQPSLAALEDLLQTSGAAAIKLAPATQAPASWKDRAELEWIGSRGECRQQVAWFGELARHVGKRAATIVDAVDGEKTVIGDDCDLPPVASTLGRFLYEPHAAVLAAGLTDAICSQHALARVSAGVAYLTSDQAVRHAALDGFEVLDVLPFDRKQLKAYCRERKIGRLEIKKRGVEVDPARLRKEIVAAGDHEATMIVSPLEGRVKAIVVKRFGLALGDENVR